MIRPLLPPLPAFCRPPNYIQTYSTYMNHFDLHTASCPMCLTHLHHVVLHGHANGVEHELLGDGGLALLFLLLVVFFVVLQVVLFVVILLYEQVRSGQVRHHLSPHPCRVGMVVPCLPRPSRCSCRPCCSAAAGPAQAAGAAAASSPPGAGPDAQTNRQTDRHYHMSEGRFTLLHITSHYITLRTTLSGICMYVCMYVYMYVCMHVQARPGPAHHVKCALP